MELESFSTQHTGLSRRELEGRAAAQLLFRIFNGQDCGLYYDEFNKPHIRQPQGHISISHSHDRLAIIYSSKENTGVDIELIRDKVRVIQHKFLSEKEQLLASNDVETLVLFWAIKESLYKVYGKKGLDFRKHLFVHSFLQNPVIAGIRINGEEELYQLRKEKLQDYMLVYVEKKIQ